MVSGPLPGAQALEGRKPDERERQESHGRGGRKRTPDRSKGQDEGGDDGSRQLPYSGPDTAVRLHHQLNGITDKWSSWQFGGVFSTGSVFARVAGNEQRMVFYFGLQFL